MEGRALPTWGGHFRHFARKDPTTESRGALGGYRTQPRAKLQHSLLGERKRTVFRNLHHRFCTLHAHYFGEKVKGLAETSVPGEWYQDRRNDLDLLLYVKSRK